MTTTLTHIHDGDLLPPLAADASNLTLDLCLVTPVLAQYRDDANGDDLVDQGDVTALTDDLLGHAPLPGYGDCTLDGVIDYREVVYRWLNPGEHTGLISFNHDSALESQTVLPFSIYNNHPQAAMALIKRGASTNISDYAGKRALDYAKAYAPSTSAHL